MLLTWFKKNRMDQKSEHLLPRQSRLTAEKIKQQKWVSPLIRFTNWVSFFISFERAWHRNYTWRVNFVDGDMRFDVIVFSICHFEHDWTVKIYFEVLWNFDEQVSNFCFPELCFCTKLNGSWSTILFKTMKTWQVIFVSLFVISKPIS